MSYPSLHPFYVSTSHGPCKAFPQASPPWVVPRYLQVQLCRRWGCSRRFTLKRGLKLCSFSPNPYCPIHVNLFPVLIHTLSGHSQPTCPGAGPIPYPNCWLKYCSWPDSHLQVGIIPATHPVEAERFISQNHKKLNLFKNTWVLLLPWTQPEVLAQSNPLPP